MCTSSTLAASRQAAIAGGDHARADARPAQRTRHGAESRTPHRRRIRNADLDIDHRLGRQAGHRGKDQMSINPATTSPSEAASRFCRHRNIPAGSGCRSRSPRAGHQDGCRAPPEPASAWSHLTYQKAGSTLPGRRPSTAPGSFPGKPPPARTSRPASPSGPSGRAARSQASQRSGAPHTILRVDPGRLQPSLQHVVQRGRTNHA